MIVVVVIISFLLWCLFAGQALIEAYVEMRKVGSGRGQVSAYPRQLESLIRLAEAHARMRLSDVVDVDDVQEARRYPPHTCEMCMELICHHAPESVSFNHLYCHCMPEVVDSAHLTITQCLQIWKTWISQGIC